jgi:hypothetical protein
MESAGELGSGMIRFAERMSVSPERTRIRQSRWDGSITAQGKWSGESREAVLGKMVTTKSVTAAAAHDGPYAWPMPHITAAGVGSLGPISLSSAGTRFRCGR